MQPDETKQDRATYTVPELAERLGLSVETIYRGIRRNDIPHIRIGARRLLLPRAAIEKWLESAGTTQMGAV